MSDDLTDENFGALAAASFRALDTEEQKTGTHWERVDALSDAEIDTSDCPALDDRFFVRATLRPPGA
jgi:hypothetical protein